MDNNTHMVIVLSTNADGVIVAEGNYIWKSTLGKIYKLGRSFDC